MMSARTMEDFPLFSCLYSFSSKFLNCILYSGSRPTNCSSAMRFSLDDIDIDGSPRPRSWAVDTVSSTTLLSYNPVIDVSVNKGPALHGGIQGIRFEKGIILWYRSPNL